MKSLWNSRKSARWWIRISGKRWKLMEFHFAISNRDCQFLFAGHFHNPFGLHLPHRSTVLSHQQHSPWLSEQQIGFRCRRQLQLNFYSRPRAVGDFHQRTSGEGHVDSFDQASARDEASFFSRRTIQVANWWTRFDYGLHSHRNESRWPIQHRSVGNHQREWLTIRFTLSLTDNLFPSTDCLVNCNLLSCPRSIQAVGGRCPQRDAHWRLAAIRQSN